MPRKNRDGRIEKIFSTLFLIAISSIMIFAILEVGARFLTRSSQWHQDDWQYSDYKRDPKPYTMFGPAPDEYRGPIASPAKGIGEYRVFILGGSTLVTGILSLPELIEKSLHEAGLTNVHVYNFGVVSQKSGQELVRLFLEVVDLH